MSIILTILHVIVAVFLVLVVLLQTGKRADLAGAFGGGGSQTAFGTRGAATLLSKMTTLAAVMFMLTSLGLSLATSRGTGERRGAVPDVEEPAAITEQQPVTDGEESVPLAGDDPPAPAEAETSDPGESRP